MIELRNLSYRYPKSSTLLLEDLNYRFEAGRSYAVTGRSGSGKTTLLSLLSGFDTPTAGAVLVQGRDLREWDADAYRVKTVGVIFQNYNLLAHLNAAENVQLALRLAGVPDPPEAALALLDRLGIGKPQARQRVTTLSGGEQQRVAIARALAGEPDILLADEPTGNLDEENRDRIVEIFCALARERGKCVILASHDSDVIARMDEVLALKHR